MEARGVIQIKENLSKQEYLTYLAESKIMTGNSIEENFGYCILEAMIFNTVPIVPNNYSHPELVKDFSDSFLFDSIDQQIIKIEANMQKRYDLSSYVLPFEDSLGKIIQECLK